MVCRPRDQCRPHCVDAIPQNWNDERCSQRRFLVFLDIYGDEYIFSHVRQNHSLTWMAVHYPFRMDQGHSRRPIVALSRHGTSQLAYLTWNRTTYKVHEEEPTSCPAPLALLVALHSCGVFGLVRKRSAGRKHISIGSVALLLYSGHGESRNTYV